MLTPGQRESIARFDILLIVFSHCAARSLGAVGCPTKFGNPLTPQCSERSCNKTTGADLAGNLKLEIIAPVRIELDVTSRLSKGPVLRELQDPIHFRAH